MRRLRWLSLGCLLVVASVVTGVADAQHAPCPAPPAASDTAAYLPCQVDEQAGILQPPTPRYPGWLQMHGGTGQVRMRAIVGADGRLEMQSVRFLEFGHESLAQAVRNSLPRTRLTPARLRGRPVRSMTEWHFEFTLPDSRFAQLLTNAYRVDTLANGSFHVVVGRERPDPPPAPLSEAELRAVATALLGAMADIVARDPSRWGSRIACVSGRARAPGVPARTPALDFLAEPDETMLAALQRADLVVLHPRRCPPTFASMVRLPSEPARPAGTDPVHLSVDHLVLEGDGHVYAHTSIAQSLSGWTWRCTVARDGRDARCIPGGSVWMH